MARGDFSKGWKYSLHNGIFTSLQPSILSLPKPRDPHHSAGSGYFSGRQGDNDTLHADLESAAEYLILLFRDILHPHKI